MLGSLAAAALVVAAMTLILYRALAPFRRIWAGDAFLASRLPTGFGGTVEARNYLAYLLWIVPGTGGLLLIGVAMLWDTLSPGLDSVVRGIGAGGFVAFLAAWPLTLVHVIVNATNRPRFLVPPPYRDLAAPFYERLGYHGDPCPQPEYPTFEIDFRAGSA